MKFMEETKILLAMRNLLRFSACIQKQAELVDSSLTDDEVICRWATKEEYISDDLKVQVCKLLVLKGLVEQE